MAWLVWPVALTTLAVLGTRCIKEKKFIEALPLLATQFNAALIWGCLAAQQVGLFNYIINGTQFLKGSQSSFRNLIITDFHSNLIYLEPLNLFLYTWRFLNQLEQEESNIKVKRFYRFLALFSIVLMPLSFYTVSTALIIQGARFSYNEYQSNRAEA